MGVAHVAVRSVTRCISSAISTLSRSSTLHLLSVPQYIWTALAPVSFVQNGQMLVLFMLE